MLRPRMILVLAVCCVLPVAEVLAAPITFNFQGTVTRFEEFAQGLPPGSVTVGASFTGSYTFDSATPNTGTNPAVGEYQHVGPPFGFLVEIGSVVFQGDAADFALTIRVVNDGVTPGGDSYTVLSAGDLVGFPGVVVSFDWRLSSSNDPFSTIALPLAPFPLDPWDTNVLTLSGENPLLDPPAPLFIIQGEVNVLTPEPTTWVLLAMSLSGLLIWKQRKRPHQSQ